MKKKFLLLLLAFTTLFESFSQKEISIVSDNDLYTSINKDRYYTNGLFFLYRFAPSKKTSSPYKTVNEIQIGQQLYTAFKASIEDPELHDRPFAGYLFAGFKQYKFYENTIFNIGVQIGVLGEKALGKETMTFIHDIYNFKEPLGWKHQITNSYNLNLNSSYIKNIWITANQNLSIEWTNHAELGTVFNKLATGFNTRIGLKKLTKHTQSVAYHGNLVNNSPKNKEFFLHINPLLHYNIYDATIQGNLFNNSSPVTFGIHPWFFSSSFGITYSTQKISLAYQYNIHTKKLKNREVLYWNKYGSIQLSYLF